LNVDYPNILEQIKDYLVVGRTESASFLMWYLEKYYRLDPLEATDSVCDNKNDKGIDGIFINEATQTIEIFQAKLAQSASKTQGDKQLREFIGTIDQFRSKERLVSMIESAGRAEVVTLISRLNLLEKLEAYNVRGIFVANIDIDQNGQDYIDSSDQIDFVGKKELEETYISDSKAVTRQSGFCFDVSDVDFASHFVDGDTKAYIVPLKANQLVNLEGIQDQSIFDYNVRGSLGNTKINKGIVKSIKDNNLHKKFPLFHNGITIVADKVEADNGVLQLENFYVVNGCQSLTSLFANQKFLSDELKILTKIIQVKTDSELASQITEYSNSQNGVKPRDFKSYNQIQIRLQNEISEKFPKYFYEIKRGELAPENKEIISNELTGIYLMSFDLMEPWGTHRKYQVFEDAYNKLFARPDVNAAKIIFLHTLAKVINEKIAEVKNPMLAKYVLTKYLIIYIVKLIMETDALGKRLVNLPSNLIKDDRDVATLSKSLNTVVEDVITDINADIGDLDEDFDYKSKLRDERWVKELAKGIVATHQKLVRRGTIETFEEVWNK